MAAAGTGTLRFRCHPIGLIPHAGPGSRHAVGGRVGHSAAMVIPTVRGTSGHRGVVEGARPPSLPVLVALVVGVFALVEAALLGLGLLVTRVLERSSLHRA